MASDWMPGAIAVPADVTGGVYPQDHSYGKNSYCTVHTFEANPHKTSAVAGAQYLNRVRYSVHFTFNPITGQIAQMIPMSRAGRGLREDSDPRTNRAGRINVQIEVMAFAATPFTSYWTPAGKAAWGGLMKFIQSWGVPPVFPNGPFSPDYGAANVPGHRVAPGPSGFYGHSDWLDNDHWDPGALDQRELLGAAASSAVALTPQQRVKMLQELLEVAVDGVWGPATSARASIMRDVAMGRVPQNAALVKTAQEVVDVTADGVWGPQSKAALVYWVRSVQRWLGVVDDGVWGPATDAAFKAAQQQYEVGSTAPSKQLAPFPLSSGEWFGVDDGSLKSHSGVRPADRASIVRIQRAVGVSADGVYGPNTAAAVKAKQKTFGLDPDGVVGPLTWSKLIGG